MTDLRRFAPATERNREPILEILKAILPRQGTVLEIASGTGEHITWFAQAMPHLSWQPSDVDAPSRESINAWIEHQQSDNVHSPLALDVMQPDWPELPKLSPPIRAILCINMIHISPWAATLGLMQHAADILSEGGLLYTYGPYQRYGQQTAPSNATFEVWLKELNSEYGVRDMEAVEQAGFDAGLILAQINPMPANNFSLVFRKATI